QLAHGSGDAIGAGQGNARRSTGSRRAIQLYERAGGWVSRRARCLAAARLEGFSMELYFLRHGKAADLSEAAASDDFGRALTSKGVDETKPLCDVLVRLGIVPDRILTSPLVRAKQTAEIVAKRLGLKKELVETDQLQPGCNLKRLRELVSDQRTCQR